jgi:fumarylacetoacetate (FAA) hydrolase
MKLASLKSGRDGKLLVVSKDLARAADATGIAPTMQAALDEWDMLSPQLKELSEKLNRNVIEGAPFDPARCTAPIPRTFHFADSTAYVNHMLISRLARGADLPKTFWTEPVIQQSGSDNLAGPRDPIEVTRDEGWGVDFESEIGAIIDDTPMGVTPDDARKQIKLLVLINDVSLRQLASGEIAKGAGFYLSKPGASMSPCAVTPDELGIAWDGGRVHLPLYTRVNGLVFGKPNAGADMTFDFPTLISFAATTRNLAAGTIFGSGPVSNAGANGHGAKSAPDGGVGYSCITEQRMVETMELGKPITPFLAFGDRVEIEMLDAGGRSIFGKIDQRVAPHERVG